MRHSLGMSTGTIRKSLEHKQAWPYWWPSCPTQWEPVWEGNLHRGKRNQDQRSLVTLLEHWDITMFQALPSLDFSPQELKNSHFRLNQFELDFFTCIHLLNTAKCTWQTFNHFVARNSVLKTILWDWYYHYSHCTDEAQRRKTCHLPKNSAVWLLSLNHYTVLININC